MTKTQAQRLRGFIARHTRCQRELAFVGSQEPEDAICIRADAEKARKALFNYIKTLEAP